MRRLHHRKKRLIPYHAIPISRYSYIALFGPQKAVIAHLRPELTLIFFNIKLLTWSFPRLLPKPRLLQRDGKCQKPGIPARASKTAQPANPGA